MAKFAVVGAGPVGALAAIALSKQGHDVTVYELRSGECPSAWPYIAAH